MRDPSVCSSVDLKEASCRPGRREAANENTAKSPEADKGKGEVPGKLHPHTGFSSPWRMALGKGPAELGRMQG